MHDFETEARAAAAPARRDKEAAAGESRSATSAHDAASLLHLQRTAGNAGVVQMLADDDAEERSPVHDVVGTGGGSPLDKTTRANMEERLGADFGDVRVHTDAKASRSAEAVGANAYTVGSDIVFRSGHFDPGSPTGQRTIAHELTHVMQQKRGPVDGTDAPGGIRVSDPSDPFERAAEAASTEALAAPANAPASVPVTVQAEADTSDDDSQVIQRETDEEDDEIPEEGDM
jgi:hypothetical protein